MSHLPGDLRIAALSPAGVGARVRGLGEALRPQPVQPAQGASMETAAAEPAPDPRAQLEEERRRVLQAARQQGYEEGHDEGLRDAEAQIEARAAAAEAKAESAWRERFAAQTERLSAASAQFEALAASLPAALESLERDLERTAAETVYAAVVRVVSAAAADGSLIAEICRDALREHAVRPAVLRVRPDAVEPVRALLGGDGLRVDADPRLEPGQCRIESGKGLYDVSLLQRMDALRDALLDALQAAPVSASNAAPTAAAANATATATASMPESDA